MYTKEKVFFKNVGKSGKLNCEYIIEAQNFLQIILMRRNVPWQMKI